MRLPRDLTGADLIARLGRIGYRSTRQTGSHVRLSCDVPVTHHVTVPLHDPLRLGTLSAILADFATAHDLEREALLKKLFD
jgi:predicted RNA binding protein YcfA (HicA-like mRNA interferase family)